MCIARFWNHQKDKKFGQVLVKLQTQKDVYGTTRTRGVKILPWNSTFSLSRSLGSLTHNVYRLHSLGSIPTIWLPSEHNMRRLLSSYKLPISIPGMEWQVQINALPEDIRAMSGIKLTTFAFQVKCLNHLTTNPISLLCSN